MHITHIIPTLSFGGAERTVVDIINASSDDFSFSVIVFFPSFELQSQITKKNVPVQVVQKTGQISLHLIGDIQTALKTLQTDVVHTHLFGGDVWGRIAAHELGLPVVTTEHNINKAEGEIKAFVKRCLNSYTQKYVACSDSVATYMKQTYKIRKPIQVIRPGIALDRFISAKPRSFFSPLRLVIVGRLEQQKGHEIALRALARIPASEWRLTIVGNGSLESSLKNLCVSLDIGNNVTFQAGTPQVQKVFAEHDVVLIPSKWEGLGMVALEAMASGNMVIASNVGGLPEVVQHKKTGLLVNAMPKDFTKAIQECIKNPVQMKFMAENAKAYATEHCGVQTMARAYENIYRSVKS